MYAEFKTGLDSNRIVNKLAHIYLFTDYYERTWKLDLDLESFEVMHGLSRVVLLLSDKIATAIEINKEDLPDPNDDGGFLIQLVINLVKFYKIRLQVGLAVANLMTTFTLVCHDWRNWDMKMRKPSGKENDFRQCQKVTF